MPQFVEVPGEPGHGRVVEVTHLGEWRDFAGVSVVVVIPRQIICSSIMFDQLLDDGHCGWLFTSRLACLRSSHFRSQALLEAG